MALIKAIYPLFNYDGEPSVSNGITYQLPSSHLSIHRVPAKLSNRVYAPRSRLLPATALVCKRFLLTLFGSTGYRSFGGCSPCFPSLVLLPVRLCSLPDSSLVPFPEPYPIPENIRYPVRLWKFYSVRVCFLVRLPSAVFGVF